MRLPHNRRHTGTRARRGVIAFTALIMLSILAVVTLSASEEVGLEVRAGQNRNDVRQACIAAQTGIDYCIYLAGFYSDWRTRFGGGTWVSNFAVGRAAVTVSAADPDDAQVAGDPIGRARFTAQAQCGLARRTIAAVASPPPGQCLRYAVCCLSNSKLNLRQGIRIYGDIRTRGNVTADADVALAGNIYTAAAATVQATLPDGDTRIVRTERAVAAPPLDLAWFESAATHLSLPVGGSRKELRRVTLGPARNPFGAANPNGLYYVDAGGSDVYLSESFVEASLVIVNAPTVTVGPAYYHATPDAKYPALLCTGNIDVRIERYLRESAADQDFNSDGDQKDIYVSRIRGVVYASGRFTGFLAGTDAGPFYVHGAVVANQIDLFGSSFHLTYDPQLATVAVAGFEGPGLALVRGSLSQ